MANIQGLMEFQARLRRIQAEIPGHLGVAIFKEASKIKNEAVKRTPHDTYALRKSAMVDGPYKKGNEISVNIIFGGPTAPYAVYVHENLDVHHPYGEAKFLERACMDHVSKMKEDLAYEIFQMWSQL